MGIIEKDGREFQPICDDCGIALCWSISEREYLIIKDYWDTWKCDVCGGGVGSINRHLEKLALDI